MVLRNNCLNVDFPDEIFHSHKECHMIKKENIGLIEVIGLTILPERLLRDIEVMKNN